jgi:hypothetical protein
MRTAALTLSDCRIVADGAATDWVLLHGPFRPKQELAAQDQGCRRGRWFVKAEESRQARRV